jgi:hypothetical protein
MIIWQPDWVTIHYKISAENSSFPQNPRYGSPLHVPQQVPYGERDSVTRATGLSIHICLPESPQKRSPPTKWGKT